MAKIEAIRTIMKARFGSYCATEQGDNFTDLSTCTGLIEACMTSILDVKKIHCKTLKVGFLAEYVLASQLVEIYLGRGSILDAANLFDGTCQKSEASWRGITTALCVNGVNWLVLDIFSRSLVDLCCPPAVPCCSALRACSGADVPFHVVEQIHAKLFRFGLSSDAFVSNPLIDLYAKNDSTDSAFLVFQELSCRDSVSRVAILSGFSRHGHCVEALLLFSQLNKSGVKLTPYVFSSVLSACTKSEYYGLGKQLHVDVLKQGLLYHSFVGNSLISMYFHSGNMIYMEQVFCEMPYHDAVTYNSLLSVYSQCGNSGKSFLIFQEMQVTGFKLDSVTTASLLSACATLPSLDAGKQLHAFVLKSGFSSDTIVEGSLLDHYVKNADIKTSYEFFDTTNKENVVLWNVMLVAHGQNGRLRETLELLHQMQVAGIRPNQHTYPSILRSCATERAANCGEQIHSQIVKNGFDFIVYVCSVLIDMYAKCGRLNNARSILENLTEKDVASWTSLIAGYIQHELCAEALKVFTIMQIQEIQSDNIGLASALCACAGIQALRQGEQIHAQSFFMGYSMDISVGNAAVCLYARCGRIREAYTAFETVENKDQVTWNALISGLAQSGHCEEALGMYSQMNQEALDANIYTFAPSISAAANMANIKLGRQIHARVIKSGHDLEIEASNALITFYAKCGALKDAEHEFFVMPMRTEVSWNAMITGYSQHGCAREVLKLFEEMCQSGLRATHITFVSILSACSHVGMVEEGLRYFKSMREDHNILPKPEHYACMVDILGRCGFLVRAREFIEQMPGVPDAMLWRTLLSACAVHKNMEIGEFAAKHLLALEPQDSASYVLLSNIYANAKKWGLRDQIRQLMKDRGIRKEPGRSWIEVRNRVHAFFAGDHLHPMASEIYSKLEDVTKKVSEIGYIKDDHTLLHDVEEEQRDSVMYTHSEKLAISFGLLSLLPDIPIYVFKNLRVCSDCHSWIKFVSKAVDRVVIVRDAYRFHHFEGGVCSCRDFW